MRDVFAEIGPEQDVHRPADTHLTFKRQTGMFGDQGIAPIRTRPGISTGW